MEGKVRGKETARGSADPKNQTNHVMLDTAEIFKVNSHVTSEEDNSIDMYLPHQDRRRSLTFLLHLSEVLEAQRITKYCSLLFFEDRLLSILGSLTEQEARFALQSKHLDLYPISLGNLQLLAVACFWISTKLHETKHSAVKGLKKLASSYITQRHFKSKDILEAEVIVLQAIKFDVSCGPSVYSCFESLLLQFRKASGLGAYVHLDACESLLDLVYDLPADYVDILRFSKPLVASAVLAVGYLLCVPAQMAKFPLITHDINLIHWLTSVANVRASQVELLIRVILSDVLECPLETTIIPELSIESCFGNKEDEFPLDIHAFDCQY